MTSELNPRLLVDRPCKDDVPYLASSMHNELVAREFTVLELSEYSEKRIIASLHMA